MSEKDKNTAKNTKNNKGSSIVTTEAESDTKNTTVSTKETECYIKKAFHIWQDSTPTDKTQIVLILCNIATIIAFIWIGSCQHIDTLKSISVADSSYNLSRQTLESQIKQWTSDSIAQFKKDSLNFTKMDSSLDLTKQSVNLAQQNFRIENRPWIGFKDISGKTLVPNQDNIYKIVFQNYGKTPALKAKVRVKYELHTITTFDKFVYPAAKGQSVIAIPPNEPLRLEDVNVDSSFLSSEEYRLLADSTHYLYLFGRIDYTDIFKGGYTTYFCFIYDMKSDWFRFSERYNTMK